MQNITEKYKQELLSMYKNNLSAEESKGANVALNNASDQSNMSGIGTLTVVVTYQKGLYPLAGAQVTVSDTSGNRLFSEKTDENGKTRQFSLPAPPKANSENPENTLPVASYYNVQISNKDFVPIIIEGIPVFDGVNSVQSFDMIFVAAANTNTAQVIKLTDTYTL